VDPRTGQLHGANTAVAIGALVPGSGDSLSCLFKAGQGPVPMTGPNWPTLPPAPCLGVACDVSGKHQIVLRAGAGLYFDRLLLAQLMHQFQLRFHRESTEGHVYLPTKGTKEPRFNAPKHPEDRVFFAGLLGVVTPVSQHNSTTTAR